MSARSEEYEPDTSAGSDDEQEMQLVPRRERDALGRVRGGVQPNVHARAVGPIARQLARYIADETGNGEELVDILLSIARGEPNAQGQVPSVIQRRAAASELYDRLAGKPVVTVDLGEAPVAGAVTVDELADAAAAAGIGIDALDTFLDAVLGGAQPGAPVIDVSPIEVAGPQDAGHMRGPSTMVVSPRGGGASPGARAPTSAPVAAGARAPRIRPLRLAPSSNIAGAVWNATARTLEVTFVSGDRWEYGGVGSSLVGEWEEAASAGAWFARTFNKRPDNIARYPRRRLGPAQTPAAPAGPVVP